MPKMSKKRKEEWAFFLNSRNRITFNELCRRCVNGCKQSFRAIVISKLFSYLKNLLNDTRAECRISDEAVESIAKCVVDDIAAFFSTQEGKKEFEEWKKKQAEMKASA